MPDSAIWADQLTRNFATVPAVDGLSLEVPAGIIFGFLVWFFVRYGLGGFYTVGPNERAVLTTFGRAQRVGEMTTLDDPVSQSLRAEERDRYAYPQVRVISPGFSWKFPWQTLYKVSIATNTG